MRPCSVGPRVTAWCGLSSPPFGELAGVSGVNAVATVYTLRSKRVRLPCVCAVCAFRIDGMRTKRARMDVLALTRRIAVCTLAT